MTTTGCSPTVHGYAGEAGRLACETSTSHPSTGLDLILLVAGGLMFILVGLALRRARRRPA